VATHKAKCGLMEAQTDRYRSLYSCKKEEAKEATKKKRHMTDDIVRKVDLHKAALKPSCLFSFN
jgi:hypothetical protein